MASKKKILVTGGSGFIGTHLIRFLLSKGFAVVNFDTIPPEDSQENVTFVKGDIVSKGGLGNVFARYRPFQTVFHLAAALPNKKLTDELLLRTNQEGTRNVIKLAAKYKAKSFVFTSSNTVYGIPPHNPVNENFAAKPLEIYGKSKLLAEEEIRKFSKDISIQIFRCPVVSGIGRLGLQAILFEFISENKNIYVLGKGDNKYQFIDVEDLCNALLKASEMKGFEIYNIGADEIKTLRQIYQAVIRHARSKSNIVSIPKSGAISILSLFDKLHLSPLGVYQYTMISRSLYQDTTKIQKKLTWRPTKTNTDLFIQNYDWYIRNKQSFKRVGESILSDNRSLPKMGVLKVLKILS